MRLSISLSAALLSLVAFVTASNVVELDDNNFDDIIGKGKPALVEFYAPWCGHCKNLAPVYEQLADAFSTDKIIIAKTDADGVGRELGSRFGVKGFPTLKWFPAGSAEPVDYSSGRDLDSLAKFVTENSGVKSKIKPPAPPAAVQLDSSNFDDIALSSKKDVLVAFTAPWCGHCKTLKPTYEKVAKAFASESNCVVAQMDADEAQNKPVAHKYGVTSFPTIKFFPKDGEPITYNQGRTEAQFVDFLNEHCGTHRTVTGLLSAAAGKLKDLDTLASSFFVNLPERSAVLSKARAYIASAEKNASASYYVKAMERVLEKGEGWLTKEQARIANLLSSPSLAPTKLDELKVKANILSSFAATKLEELEDVASDVYDDAVDAAKKLPGQAAEGVDSFVKMMEDTGARIKEEL